MLTRDAVIFGISGTFFGLLVGWIIGSQQARPAPAAPVAAAASQSPAEPETSALDVQRAAELERRANAEPQNAAVRIELGNVFYDARRFDQAIPWYEAALKIDARNIGASTDLAVCYFTTNQPDRALRQIDYSLSIDSRHLKTLLNQGIIRQMGKGDSKGAIESWQKIIDIAPGSEEARLAQQGLDGLKSGHGRRGTSDQPKSSGGES